MMQQLKMTICGFRKVLLALRHAAAKTKLSQSGMRKNRAGSTLDLCLRRCISVAMVLLGNSTYGQESRSIAQSEYPPIYARGSAFTGRQCTSTAATTPSSDEIYILKGTTNWQRQQELKVEVAEFFSGKTYEATLSIEAGYVAVLTSTRETVRLNCASPDRTIGLGKRRPINEKGDYLAIVNIDASGSYGEYVSIDTCQIGSHCDIGSQGLVLKNLSGEELWGKLVAIRDNKPYAHPSYRLPNLYRIQTSEFSYATKLLDGTALFSFDDLMTIRISLKTGDMAMPHSDVSTVNLKTWAQLKQILDARFLHADKQCDSTEKAKGCDWQRRTELYFYSLRDYLYPNQF